MTLYLKTATLEIVVRPFTTQGGWTIYTTEAGTRFGYIPASFTRSLDNAVLLRHLSTGYSHIGRELDPLAREARPGRFAFREHGDVLLVVEAGRPKVTLPNAFFEPEDAGIAYELSDLLAAMADVIVGTDRSPLPVIA